MIRMRADAHLPIGLRFTLIVGVAAALCIGLYARFAGLGTWPLTVDEYYLARSIQNILHSGLPAFPCGGYYLRGLLLQYLAASLQWLGFPPELSTRSLAACASLATLPAAYLLGQRAGGRIVGLLAVAILSVSVWEVELARFGRMYAPFQAVFLWYLVFFLRHVQDRDARALWGMIALTVAGVLIWEGGVLLAFANLLVPFLRNGFERPTRRDWVYLTAAGAFFLTLYLFTHTDFRGSAELQSDVVGQSTAGLWQTAMRHGWLWGLLGLIPATAALLSCRWLWSLRRRWPAMCGLAMALLAALAHQFAAAAILLLLLLLSALLRWQELATRQAAPYVLAILLSLVFWTLFAAQSPEWLTQIDTPWRVDHPWLRAGYEFLRVPDIPTEIIWPWARAVPHLGLGLLLLVAAAAARVIIASKDEQIALRLLLVVIVCMLALTGASGPPRHETRYVYFLFPAVLVASLAIIDWGMQAIIRRASLAATCTVLIASSAFALSEDFSPKHLARIDRQEINFRVGVPDALAGHWVSRADVRGAADWLSRHVQASRDLAVNAVPSTDFYFPGFSFTYIDERHQRFAAYACENGSTERWGNLPLLSSMASLHRQIDAHERTFLVVYKRNAEAFTVPPGRHAAEVLWTSVDGDIVILGLAPANDPAQPDP